MEQFKSAGEKKIQEYVDRIKAGESKDSIMQGLSPSFVAGIEANLNISDQIIASEIKKSDETKIEELRKKLGIISDDISVSKQENQSSFENNNSLSDLVKSVSQGRKQIVIDLYKNLFDHIDSPESRQKLASALFQDVYNRYRIAEYPTNPAEEQTWDDALINKKVDIDNKNKEWMYRGVFPRNGEETVTRGSFNVNVTPELIGGLDDMIASGKIKANYKFGQPGTTTSPTERHDSISIYFLEQPSDEMLQELSALIKPYVRGDNLLGKKIGDGFFISEIGSIETKHIEFFVEQLKLKDPAFAKAVELYASPQPGRGKSLKMSEAQYYSIKDVAQAFGYRISYNKDTGFEIK